MTRVALMGNSVPQGLILKFLSSAHPDLTLLDATNIGCDPLEAPRHMDGQVLPEGKDCSAWREGWGEKFASDTPDVVIYFVAQTMVTDRLVEGRVIAFGSSEWVALVEDGLDNAKEAAGPSQFAVMNLACHEMPTFGNEEITRVNDVQYVQTLNATVQNWAQRKNVPVLDQYSLLCPDGEYHDTVNEVALYEDSIHFTSQSAPVFWHWLAPRVQQISLGKDPS